ncbi:UNVERIFIED_CONTAM: hypothetical protein FKN15_009437 [Acipenser sinensis]
MLTAVEKLKASLRQSFSAGGDGAEAVVKNVDVLKAIEEVIQDIVLQLSQGKAPALSFHKRTQWSNIRFDDTVGLQMAPDCTVSTVRSDCCTSVVRFSLILKVLSMIYKLVQSNTYATKRDIYYNDTQLFGSERTLDLIVIDISCMLKVPRRSLHVLATSKGFIAGDLCYTEEDGTRVNCSSNSTDISVHNVAQYLNSEDVFSAAQFLLIVEKDATFQRLLDDEFCIKLAPCIIITVTMAERSAAEMACKDPNPIIDGRKANVNLAYLGAKPRSMQTGFTLGVQQIHPALIQRQYGLAQQYMYPQAFVQPSLMIPSQLSSVSSPYADYNAICAQYASAAFEQYPYAASPGFLGYSYPPTVAAAAASAMQQPLSTAAHTPAAAFVQYPSQQVQPDRLQ